MKLYVLIKGAWIMKKAFFVFLTAVLTGTAVFAQSLPRLAVVEFTVNLNTQKANTDAITVRNLSESQIIGTGKYEVIARNDIDALLANQKIAVSSISSSENIKKLQLYNISYIVTGSVDVMDGDYAVTIKILDVSTGRFSHSASDFMGSTSRELYAGVNKLVTTFVSGMSSEGGAVVQTDTSKAKTGGSGQLYKVGDRGPGGGFVFYAEGGMYMECSLNLGSFTWDNAVNAAKNYRGGGFSDWHLPVKDELNMIYVNLKKNGLGGLFDEKYWSSSQYNSDYAWYQRFSDGYQDYYYKYTAYCVRAVRAF